VVEAKMTAVPDYNEFRDVIALDQRVSEARLFEVEETYWGYTIHSKERAPLWLTFSQAVSWVLGVLFAIGALGMWALPGNGLAADMIGFKMGASIPLAGVSLLMLWYSSRGSRVEVQIDTTRGEVREVLRNRAGRMTILGLYGFDSIGGVFLERSEARLSGQVQLVLRYRNTAQVLRVARGSEPMLQGLRDRLGRDLMVRGKSHPLRAVERRSAVSSAA
jgi:hypothetical protein